MAEAYGKLTGRPGICLVTRGPGATQASVGVHTAFQDATPLILLVGQIPASRCRPRGVPGGRLRSGCSGRSRSGSHRSTRSNASRSSSRGRSAPRRRAVRGPSSWRCPRTCSSSRPTSPTPRRTGLRRPRPGSQSSRRSGGCWPKRSVRWRSSAGSHGRERPARSSRRGCEASGVPVAAAWRCQDYVDNDAPCYAGHLGLGQDPALTARLRDADVLLVVGARLGDIETAGFSTLVPPGAGRTLIHVHPDPNELGRVYEPALGIVASGPRFAEALAGLAAGSTERGESDAAHAAYRATLEARRLPGAVEMGEVMRALRERLAARRDRRERRGELLRLGAPLLRLPALPHAARAALRRDGVRAARGRGGEARPSRAARRLHRGRRGLPDERARARDRPAVRGADRRARGRQRDVRDDSNAPGAPIPGPGQRHRAREPGLRRARARRSAPTASGSSGARTCPRLSSAP